MASLLSNYFGNAVLNNWFVNQTTYLALHLSDPGVGGTLSTELSGGGYDRRRTTWSTPSNKTIATTNSQIFTDLPACIVAYLGVWTDPDGGHLLWRTALSPGVTVPAAGQFIAVTGDIALTI